MSTTKCITFYLSKKQTQLWQVYMRIVFRLLYMCRLLLMSYAVMNAKKMGALSVNRPTEHWIGQLVWKNMNRLRVCVANFLPQNISNLCLVYSQLREICYVHPESVSVYTHITVSFIGHRLKSELDSGLWTLESGLWTWGGGGGGR